MILFYYFQNDIEMDQVQPSHSRQSKTEYMDLKEVTAFESKRKEEETIDTPQVKRSSLGTDYAPLHPSTRSWEIPRNSVTIEKRLSIKVPLVRLPKEPR